MKTSQYQLISFTATFFVIAEKHLPGQHHQFDVHKS